MDNNTDTNVELTTDELRAQIEQLKQENATLKVKQERKIGLKVSQKGGVSFYGLQRFPVTLYKKQWLTLLSRKEEILAFIEANDADLTDKE